MFVKGATGVREAVLKHMNENAHIIPLQNVTNPIPVLGRMT